MRVKRRGVGTVIGMAIFLVLALLVAGTFVVVFQEYTGYQMAVKGYDAAQQAKGLDNTQITGVSFGASATRGPYDARNGPTVAAPLLPYNYTNGYEPVCDTASPYYSTLCHTATHNPPSDYPASLPFPLSFTSQDRVAEYTPIQNENFSTSSAGWTSDVFYPAGSGVSSGLLAGYDPTDASLGSPGSPSGPGVLFVSSNINPPSGTSTPGFLVEWKYEMFVNMSTFGTSSPCSSGCPTAYFSYARFMSGFYLGIPELNQLVVQFAIQDPAGNNYTIPIPLNSGANCGTTGELCYTSPAAADTQWVESTGINITSLLANSGPAKGTTRDVFSSTGFYILTLYANFNLKSVKGNNGLQEARMFFDDIGIGLYYHANVVDQTLDYVVPSCLTAQEATNSTECPNGVTGESPSILSQISFNFAGSTSSQANMYIYVNEFTQARPVGTGASASYVFDWNQIDTATISNGPFSFSWNNGVFDVRLFVNQNELVFGNTAIPPIPVGAVEFRFYIIQPRATNPGALTFTVSSGSTATDAWPNQNHVTVGFENLSNLEGATSHLVSLWVIGSTSEVNYNTASTPEFDVYLSPGETYSLTLNFAWSSGSYTFIVVTSTGAEYTFVASPP